MSDNFLARYKENAAARISDQTFEVDLSEYSEAFEGELWSIKPLNGKMQDKIIPLYVRDHKLYEAIATSLLYRACKHGTTIRRFKNPSVVEELMSDTEFLEWFAEKIKFHEEMRAFLSGEAEEEAVKNSEGTTGAMESS